MPIRISAKTLGQLAMPDCCPRCFWLRIKLRWPTWNCPSIFLVMDSYAKGHTTSAFNRHGRLPPWFSFFNGLVRPVPVPHHSRFQIVHAPSGVLLTGAPDEIIEREDGSYVIIDYKTSRHTETQDSLMPIYRVQLNAYAFIHERLKMGPVSDLGLIYFEPQSNITKETIEPFLLADGFLMPFKAKVVPVKLSLSIIPPLLREAQRICGSDRPPKSRSSCKDCEKMGELMHILKRRPNRIAFEVGTR